MGNPQSAGLWKRPGPTAIQYGKNAASARKGIRARMHLSGNWTHALTVVAIGAAPASADRTEAEAVSAALALRILRTRQTVAVRAMAVEVSAIAVAGSGQEDTPAVGTGELATLHTILRRPNALVTLVEKFLDLVKCRQLPWTAPLHMSNVVLRATDARTKVVAGT